MYPGKPFEPMADRTVVTIPARQFWALPQSVQNLFKTYRTREYWDGRTVWIEIPNYRISELFAEAKRMGMMQDA